LPKVDTYEWTKNKIAGLIKNVQTWNDEYITTAKHGIWSIKKLIALDYYIDSYVKILKSKQFKSWKYVDPFSGSGLLRIDKNHLFPGSALIPLFKIDNFPFHQYILSDIDPVYVELLKKRINKIIKSTINQNIKISIQKQDCNSLIQQIFSGTKPVDWKDCSYLVFLDPFGWDIQWKSMERILNSGPVDLVFTFMTWEIMWNRTIKNSKQTLNAFFGDDHWESIKDGNELVNYYCNKIKTFGYKNKYNTFIIDVFTTSGKRYNLILASQSFGAGRVFNDLQKRVNAVTTECLQGAFDVTVRKKRDLTEFFK
jgi:three-Cys-motif partner protein